LLKLRAAIKPYRDGEYKDSIGLWEGTEQKIPQGMEDK